MKRKSKAFEQLEILYLFTFALGVLIIAPTHIFPQPYFMYARFPHYLELMGPFFGLTWPFTFEIYHYVLYILTIAVSFNALGIVFYPSLKKIAIFSSMIGIFLFSLMILFFFFKFVSVNASTAVVFGLYSIVLLIVDLLTYKVLTKQKAA